MYPPDACQFVCMERAFVLMPVGRCDYVCKLMSVWSCMYYAYAGIFGAGDGEGESGEEEKR